MSFFSSLRPTVFSTRPSYIVFLNTKLKTKNHGHPLLRDLLDLLVRFFTEKFWTIVMIQKLNLLPYSLMTIHGTLYSLKI